MGLFVNGKTHPLTFFRYCGMLPQSLLIIVMAFLVKGILRKTDLIVIEAKNALQSQVHFASLNTYGPTKIFILRDTKTMMTEKPAEPECTCRHVTHGILKSSILIITCRLGQMEAATETNSVHGKYTR